MKNTGKSVPEKPAKEVEGLAPLSRKRPRKEDHQVVKIRVGDLEVSVTSRRAG